MALVRLQLQGQPPGPCLPGVGGVEGDGAVEVDVVAAAQGDVQVADGVWTAIKGLAQVLSGCT